MAKYDIHWQGLDPGREGLWNGPVWLGVLRIIGDHQGENVYDPESPIYEELEAAFPDNAWRSYERNGRFRPLFRDYSQPWTRSGVLDLSDQTFRLTHLGRKVVSGDIAPSKVMIETMRNHSEDGDYPFRIISAAFLEAESPLSFNDIFLGVMKNYRPGIDNLKNALESIREEPLPSSPTAIRRLKQMLSSLEQAGAIDQNKGEEWVGWNLDLLDYIATSPASVTGDVTTDVASLISSFTASLNNSNLFYSEEFVCRLVASILAKRFVILTGLSGSGKTKLAQALAIWLSPSGTVEADPFISGKEIIGESAVYYVKNSDRLSVELLNSKNEEEAIKVALPRALIDEWVKVIRENDFSRDTSPIEIREKVAETTKYSAQLNSFHSPLKAAAFAVIQSKYQAQPQYFGNYEVVAVGADWTSNEHVLGYPDALDPNRFVRTKALDLIMRAGKPEYSGIPHFLILDEMNLSHVERYFSDILSSIESGEELYLHSDKDDGGRFAERDGVPPSVELPPNLFIIGTVNVDETTYMFSPKVLDRANVLEFRIDEDVFKSYIEDPKSALLSHLKGLGSSYSKSIADLAKGYVALEPDTKRKYEVEMTLFFEYLREYGMEFGFRTSNEIARFIGCHKLLKGSGWDFKIAMDAQILQKILPKFNGTRKQLEAPLVGLATLCYYGRNWIGEGANVQLENFSNLLMDAKKAARLDLGGFHPVDRDDHGVLIYPPESAYYPLSYNKAYRMLRTLDVNGFASFAEA